MGTKGKAMSARKSEARPKTGNWRPFRPAGMSDGAWKTILLLHRYPTDEMDADERKHGICYGPFGAGPWKVLTKGVMNGWKNAFACNEDEVFSVLQAGEKAGVGCARFLWRCCDAQIRGMLRKGGFGEGGRSEGGRTHRKRI